MKVQCSVQETMAHAMQESPAHALNGNQDHPEIWQVCIAAGTIAPPWVQWWNTDYDETGQPVIYDNVTLAVRRNTYFFEHDWAVEFPIAFDANGNPIPPLGGYAQNDTADQSTFVVSSNVLVNVGNTGQPVVQNPPVNPFGGPPGGIPGGPNWQNYPNDVAAPGVINSLLSSAWNPAPDMTKLIAMLYGVDFSSIWAGNGLPISAATNAGYPIPAGQTGNYWGSGTETYVLGNFNRGQNGLFVGLNSGGIPQYLPADGILYASPSNQIIAPTQSFGDGSSGFPNPFTPQRIQYQIRNFIATVPIEYNFLELVPTFRLQDGPGGNTNVAPGGILVQIPRGGGQFTQNNQIVEVPFPQTKPFSMSNGAFIGAPQVIFLVGGSQMENRV